MSPHRVLPSLQDLCDQAVSPDKSNCCQRYSQTDFLYCLWAGKVIPRPIARRSTRPRVRWRTDYPLTRRTMHRSGPPRPVRVLTPSTPFAYPQVVSSRSACFRVAGFSVSAGSGIYAASSIPGSSTQKVTPAATCRRATFICCLTRLWDKWIGTLGTIESPAKTGRFWPIQVIRGAVVRTASVGCR